MPIWAIIYCVQAKSRPQLSLSQQGGGIMVNQNGRHHHETETVAEIKNLKKSDNYVRSQKYAYYPYVMGKNDDRVIGALSTGRGEMLDSERGRFQLGRDYTNSGMSAAAVSYRRKKSQSSAGDVIFVIFVILFILFTLLAVVVAEAVEVIRRVVVGTLGIPDRAGTRDQVGILDQVGIRAVVLIIVMIIRKELLDGNRK